MTDVALFEMTPATGRPSNSMVFALGRVDGKLDQLLVQIPSLKADITAIRNDFGNRLVRLEVWQGRMGGAIAVIVFLITALEVIPYVLKLIH